MTHLSRREFATLAASAAVAPLALRAAPVRAATITTQELIDRIKAQIGVPWKAETVDGLKAGDPTTPVTGIVTTALPSLAVLQQAVKAGENVVICSQPAFFSKADARTPPARRGPGGPNAPPPGTPPPPAEPGPPDAVFTVKNKYIDEHNLVVIRLSDHWRVREPDPLAQGLAAALGWSAFQVAGDPKRYDVPAQTVEALVDTLGKKLGASGGIRVVGDPKTSVKKIGLLPGSTPLKASLDLLPGVDAIVAGEVREWESVEYVRDVVASGGKKALILVGRIVSEEPGMQACAGWLKTVVPGVPVRHLAAGDPYWRPAR